MSDRGEPDVYEITWNSGHIERVLAHQVSWPNSGQVLTRALFGVGGEDTDKPRRILFHAEIDGRWLLTLSALEEDMRCVRLVTESEPIPGGAS